MLFDSFKITKSFIKGRGHDTVGTYEIGGTLAGNQVTFLKQYIGLHAVEYTGTLNKERTEIKGYWAMPSANLRDMFFIKVGLYSLIYLYFIEKVRREQCQRLGLSDLKNLLY